MKFRFGKNEAGFSLVELMVVVGIIGILASLALPKMQVFMAKARQAEAKSKLSNVYVLQQSYFTESNQFSATAADIGLNTAVGSNDFYDAPTLAAPNPTTGFTATVTSRRSICAGAATTDDVWNIDQDRTIKAQASALTKCK
jgi:prepilin-type N-terminal cleavage/methylation domain-containing protein